MATPILLPKLGNTVETCIIETWHKQVGDPVQVGDVLCDVETDKATLEVEATAAGTILALHFAVGDEVAVLATIATVGEAGETVQSVTALASDAPSPISPRARKLAAQNGVDVSGLAGSGPNGRIIERDVVARVDDASAAAPAMTPIAKRMVDSGEFHAPAQGSGPKGRIMRRDLDSGVVQVPAAESITVIPVKGPRKVIAQRMLNSVQTTAPFTLHRYADARALKRYRQRLKESAPQLGLADITLTDLVLFATVRSLSQHPELNAHFLQTEIHQFGRVDLGFAVDTPRGLMVPVIRAADSLSLFALSSEVKRLVDACQSGRISPDELAGGTFTVSNLGSLGIETFTPVLNPPQVGILGVGNITLRPVENAAEVQTVPHLALSLTVDHQAVDGAPAARFLQTVGTNLANIDLLSA